MEIPNNFNVMFSLRGFVMTENFCKIDDKHVPLFRVIWVSEVPHFCGHPECEQEGRYEIRLEQGESVWGNREERDATLTALEIWQGGTAAGDEDWG